MSLQQQNKKLIDGLVKNYIDIIELVKDNDNYLNNRLGVLEEIVMSKKTEAITNGLKACPFCGGVSKRFNSKDMFFVSCSECFMKTEEFIRMEFAIHKWNKRV